MLKKIYKILAIILGSLIGVLLICIVFIKLGYFNPFIAQTLSNLASKNINADVKIEFLKGDVFSAFDLQNILIFTDSDSIITCDEIKIDYSLRNIFQKRIDLNHMHLIGVHLKSVQENDSSWNFMNVFKSNSKTESPSGDLNWIINLNDFRLDYFSTEITSVSESQYIPTYIESNIALNGHVSDYSITIQIDTLNLSAVKPDYEIFNLSGILILDSTGISWNNIDMQLINSLINSQGKIMFAEQKAIQTKITANPLDFEDFGFLFPDLNLYGTPDIDILVHGNSNQYHVNISIIENQQKVKLTGWLKNYEKNPKYELIINVDSLNGAYWTQDESLNSNIAGQLKAQGKGFNIRENEFDIQGDFGNIKYDKYSLTDLVIRTSKRKGRLSGKLEANTWIGDFKLNYNLSNIFDYILYDITCDYKNLNLKELPGIDSVQTDLNGYFSIAGKGISMDELDAKIIINSKNSRLLDYPVHDFKIMGSYNKGDYDFDGLNLETPYFMLNAKGKGNLFTKNNIDFEFEPRNIYDLVSEFEIPIFDVKGHINGNVNGSMDSLNGNISMALTNINYDSLCIEKLSTNFQVSLFDSIYNGNISLHSENINYYGLHADEVNFTNKLSNNLINCDINVNINDSLETSFFGDIEGFENPLIRIQKLRINYQNTAWSNVGESTYINLNSGFIFVNDFTLQSGNQSLKIHGRFTFEGEEELAIQLENLQLNELPFNNQFPFKVSGILSSDLKLTGTSTNPIIANKLFMNNLIVNNYEIENIHAQMNFKDEVLSYSSIVNSKLHRMINVSINIPLYLTFNDEIYLLKDNPEFSASMRFDSLDLRKIYAIYPLEDITISGLAFSNLNISNTINDPVFNGSIDISTGKFGNTSYGANYNDIQLACMIKDNQIAIHKFTAKSNKKGKLNIDGFINLQSNLSPIPEDFELNFFATNFQALKSNRVELNFSTDLKLAGPFSDPRFIGDLQIIRSRINADYFGKYLGQKTDDPNPPLLIKALNDASSEFKIDDSDQIEFKLYGTKFYKSLSGEVILKIPGNTWVKGKNMNFELEGSLQALKSSDNIDLFGTLKVKRGFYKIYGKNFTFSKGELRFTGGKEINPYLDFVILYRFRDIEKELKKLGLNITGRMLEPEMEFILDEKVIDEKDAIAYIVFGKSLNQLSETQKNKLLNSENIAVNLALDQISSLLKETVQRTTRLDVFEIAGEDSWKSSSVTLGKYITNKLYFSYEHTFTFDKKTKVVDSEKLMLDYQLLRNLILKATNQNTNSGFDLIYKKTWR